MVLERVGTYGRGQTSPQALPRSNAKTLVAAVERS